MRKSVLIMVVFAMLFAFTAVSCGEKKTVDERANVKELVEKGEYQQAKVLGFRTTIAAPPPNSDARSA